jgi:hypothetical protein
MQMITNNYEIANVSSHLCTQITIIGGSCSIILLLYIYNIFHLLNMGQFIAFYFMSSFSNYGYFKFQVWFFLSLRFNFSSCISPHCRTMNTLLLGKVPSDGTSSKCV